MTRARLIFVRRTPANMQFLSKNPNWELEWTGVGEWFLIRSEDQTILRQARGATDARVFHPRKLSQTFRRLPAAVQQFIEGLGLTPDPGDTLEDIISLARGDEGFES